MGKYIQHVPLWCNRKNRNDHPISLAQHMVGHVLPYISSNGKGPQHVPNLRPSLCFPDAIGELNCDAALRPWLWSW